MDWFLSYGMGVAIETLGLMIPLQIKHPNLPNNHNSHKSCYPSGKFQDLYLNDTQKIPYDMKSEIPLYHRAWSLQLPKLEGWKVRWIIPKGCIPSKCLNSLPRRVFHFSQVVSDSIENQAFKKSGTTSIQFIYYPLLSHTGCLNGILIRVYECLW